MLTPRHPGIRSTSWRTEHTVRKATVPIHSRYSRYCC